MRNEMFILVVACKLLSGYESTLPILKEIFQWLYFASKMTSERISAPDFANYLGGHGPRPLSCCFLTHVPRLSVGSPSTVSLGTRLAYANTDY